MRRLTILLATAAALLLVPAAAQAAPGVEHLKVNITGSGSGKVITNPGAEHYKGSPEINCTYTSPGTATGTCEDLMSNEGEGFEQVFLEAVAAEGSEFVEWTVQEGNVESCIKLSAKVGVCAPYVEPEENEEPVELTAVFAAIPPVGPALKVTHEGSGGGTIQSNPAGITCTSGECEHSFAEGETVELTASPSAGSAFVSWKNCDSGGVHGRECTVHVTPGHKTVGAKFEPANTVTVKTKGTGTGSVSGVTCGNTCTEASGIFVATKAVTLKAKPYVKNSELVGWSASPASCTLSEEGKTCSLGLLSANETVEAEFKEMARETLTLTKSGNGQGSVKSAPAGINCSYTCGSNAAYYYKGTSVTLTAAVQAGKGSALGNWGGACSGTEATPCVVSMSTAKSVTAEFK